MRSLLSRSLSLLVVVCAAVWGALPAQADPVVLTDIDPSGTYWHGCIGTSPDPATLWASMGQDVFTKTSATTGSAVGGGQATDGNYVDEMVFTNWATNAQGWTTVSGYNHLDSNKPFTATLAMTPNAWVCVDRTSNPGGSPGWLGMDLFLRQNTGVQASDVPGTYALFGHDVGSGVSWSGTAIMNADGNLTYSMLDSTSAVPDQGRGTWALASGQPILNMQASTSDPNIIDHSFQLFLGKGGMSTLFTVDPNEGLSYEVQAKLGSDRTLSEAVGHWLIQGFVTDANGVPETAWGTCDVGADGDFVSSLSTSLHPSDAFSGTGRIVLDSNGMATFTEDADGHITTGFLNRDGDLMVLSLNDGLPDSEAATGLMFAVKAVPEPATLAILAAGAAFLVRRRRTPLAHLPGRNHSPPDA